MDGAVSTRTIAASVVLVAAVAIPAAAQERAMVPLAEVARQAEAAKATLAKAKKSYTNTDLHVSTESQAMVPAADASKADVSASGKSTASEQTTNTGNEKAPAEPAQTQPEAYWRQRADFIRSQVEKAKSEIARLNVVVPGRSAALEASNANEIKKYQQMLDGAMKQWALLEASAQASKVPAAWIGSAP